MIHFVTIYFKTFYSTMQLPGSLHRKAFTDKIPLSLGEKCQLYSKSCVQSGYIIIHINTTWFIYENYMPTNCTTGRNG